MRDCSVCAFPENDFLEPFKMMKRYGLPSDDLKCQEGKPQAAVHSSLHSNAFRKGWMEVDKSMEAERQSLFWISGRGRDVDAQVLWIYGSSRFTWEGW